MVITNKLGITDSPTLAREEERISKKSAARLFEQNLLNNMSSGTWATLQDIHKVLFQDIYDFAGELRTVNISKGNFILAGHSGSGRVSYFKNLDKLVIGDISYIYYGGIKYTYKVTNIYDIEKNGTALITRDLDKTTLTMITCRHNTNKQIIVISELINQENY